MLLIGSRALEVVAPHLLDRTPRDWDFVATPEEAEAFAADFPGATTYPEDRGKKLIVKCSAGIFEFELAWPGSTAEELLRWYTEPSPGRWLGLDKLRVESLGIEVFVASLDWLFTLKKSHRFLRNSPHFLKTMVDYRKLHSAGAQVPDPAWLKRREAETYWYKHPKLGVSKADFFKGDGVEYIYDHDTIHIAMQHLERPAYTYLKPPDRDVLCDRKMFEAADERTRLYSVLEESYVLALERSQIPHRGVLTPRQSFEKALMKVCTSITSGWWREYAYEHYHDALGLYDDSYVDRFWRAVEAGVVRKLEPGATSQYG